MKIAITSTGTDLTAQVDPRFGRCPYYIFIDSDTLRFEAVENPNVSAMGGAGIQSAQFIANRGAQVVLTGSCGPNAFQTLTAAGVKVVVGVVGTVSDAVNRFKSGQLSPALSPNAPPHFGMGRGMGPFGMSGPMGPINPAQELAMLKQTADMLAQQIEMINQKIKDIEARLK
ncbi:MAG TPA: dinitrogenase iron-molybdenum cofactor biosynthesis protein [bacterium (Candidatus Stahlbacteria)]|nr:dinitrogenase iron-molybdenum cofactor biosynthesis protein [Candidatus Stahlbacteria bacterium]